MAMNQFELLREISERMARVETKVDGLRADRAEDRLYLTETSKRVGRLERLEASGKGWLAGAAAVVSIVTTVIIMAVKEMWPR